MTGTVTGAVVGRVRRLGARRSVSVPEGEVAYLGAVRVNAVLVLLLVLALVWAASGGPYVMTVVGLFAAYVVAGTGYNIVLGLCGQMAFGQAGFMAIGAYICAVLLQAGYGDVVSVGGGVGAAGLVAGLTGGAVLRTKHIYLALVTLAFSEATLKLIELWPSTHGDDGIDARLFGTRAYAVAAVVGMLCLVLVDRVVRSRHGRALAMIRADEEVAVAMGVRITRVKVAAYVASGVMGGAGGIFLAGVLTFVTPTNFNSDLTILLLTMIVLGGMGTVWGPTVGAVVIVYANQKLADTLSFQPILYGVIIYAVLRLLPNGLVSIPREVLRLARLRRRGGRNPAVATGERPAEGTAEYPAEGTVAGTAPRPTGAKAGDDA